MCSRAHVHAHTQMVENGCPHENVTFYTAHTRTCAKRTKESEPLKTCVRGTGKTSEKRAKQLIFTNVLFALWLSSAGTPSGRNRIV